MSVSLWAVTMVRDELDIIEATLRHLESEGVEGIIVADNLSTDGTYEWLQDNAANFDCQLLVQQDPDPAYYQSRKMTALAHQAFELGAAWTLPFDADEIWYNGNTTLELNLTPPDGAATLGPVALHARYDITRPSDQKVIGTIDHTPSLGNNDHRIVIILSSTVENAVAINAAPGTQAGIPLPPSAPAPSGIWKIDLTNTGTKRAEFHAWIERDATGGRGSARRQQSHFLAVKANPSCTLGGLATGVHTIAVGGYNAATHEICRYSACGPTRAIGANHKTIREKPEVCAPAESDPPGRGTLSASSERAQPTRMNGTSASAPHVAGLVALMYQYIRDAGRPTLTADEIKDRIMQGAQSSQPLKYNRHQQANDARPHKQQNMRLKDLTGSGKLNIKETLKRL